jgi:uncharacterized protein YyaL (SSP411 family)
MFLLCWWLACAPAPGPAHEVPFPRDDALVARLEAVSDGRSHTNRLALQASPYLRQHAHNPVDWFPWGEEAFDLARRLDRPVLLSIGYATCHWCHVMEEESFSDPEIAEVINRLYVPIKVDREERPDIDAIYLAAMQRMGRRGGWPMTLWLDPDGQPFYAATYLPPRPGDRGATTAFLPLLTKLADAWATDRANIEEVAADLQQAVAKALSAPAPGELPDGETLSRVLAPLAARYDPVHGGRKGAPKFPTSLPLRTLLLHGRSDPTSRDMALHTLRQLAHSGLHDPLSGGFHRYAVDARWQVPHFEKMLYDNARLAHAYVDAWRLTREPLFRAVAEQTLRFVDAELSHPSGGFAAALDADSLDPATGRREEGRFYTFTGDELDELLGERAPRARAALHVDDEGAVDGRSVLRAQRPLDPALHDVLDALRSHRATRPPPPRDELVVTAWNALAVRAFAQAALAFDDPTLAARALRAGEVLRGASTDGRLPRTLPQGGPGVLEDHALWAAAALDLFELSGDAVWLREALAVDRALEAHFRLPGGAWARTADDAEPLLTREVPARDEVVPSGGSVHPYTLLRLHALTADDRYRQRAEAAMRAQSVPLEQGALPVLLEAVDARHAPFVQAVFITTPSDDGRALREAWQRHRPRHGVQLVVAEPEVDELAEHVPVVAGKLARDGRATAYVCLGGHCEAPTSDPQTLAEQLRAIDPVPTQ